MKKIVPKNAEIERFIRGEQQNAKSKNKNPTQKCRKLSISFYLLQGGISRSSLFLYVCTGFRESWNLFSNIIFHSISPLVSLVSHLEPRNLVCCCVFKLVSQLVCNCVSDRLFPLLVPCVSPSLSPTACRTVLAWFPNLSPTIISTLSLTLSVISFPC